MCREAFHPEDDVVLSLEGWAQGLSVHYAYTFGKVVSHEDGILTVLREGVDRPQEFACRFWEPCDTKTIKHLRKHEYDWYWRDHYADPIDDYQFSDE